MLTQSRQAYKSLIEYDFFYTQESKVYSKFFHYKPNMKLSIRNHKYELKTADNVDELINCFKLRYDCFLAHHKNSYDCFDFDEFDDYYDHMIIKEIGSQKVIGTYRLANSLHHQKFYTSNEFHIDQLFKLPGVKLELGRACIMPEYRTGSVLDMLWKGIAAYTKKIDAKYLFGCTSIHTEDPKAISSLFAYLKTIEAYNENLNIEVVDKYKMQLQGCKEVDQELLKKIYPSLLKSYIKAGAKLIGEPAHDKEFHCVDLLTLFEPEKASEFFKKRYFH